MLDTYGIIKGLRHTTAASSLTQVVTCYTIRKPVRLGRGVSKQLPQPQPGGLCVCEDMMSTVDVADIAAALGVTQATVYEWVRQGKLRSLGEHKHKQQMRFDASEARQFISAYRIAHDPVQCFWDRVDTSGRCWLWTGTIRSADNPYGEFRVNGERYIAHRFSYELAYGPIPDGLWVLHRCDIPQCVRPEHLFLGTCADNNADKAMKLRAPHGEAHCRAYLTEEQVRQIRRQYADGVSVRQLIFIHGIPKGTIKDIVSRKTWKHI